MSFDPSDLAPTEPPGFSGTDDARAGEARDGAHGGGGGSAHPRDIASPPNATGLSDLEASEGVTIDAPPTSLRVNTTRYAVRTLHGRGGMGEVWVCHDTMIGREVALKRM